MILDLSKIEETITPHFKGGEKEMAIRAYAEEDLVFFAVVPQQ